MDGDTASPWNIIGGERLSKSFPRVLVQSSMFLPQPTFHLSLILLCQEEEGGVCLEVVQREATGECPWVPRGQWEGPADRARHAPPPLHPHFASGRDPDWVEGRHRYTAVRGLKVVLFVRVWTWVCVCVQDIQEKLKNKRQNKVPGCWHQRDTGQRKEHGSVSGHFLRLSCQRKIKAAEKLPEKKNIEFERGFDLLKMLSPDCKLNVGAFRYCL